MKDAYQGWSLAFHAVRASRVKIVRYLLLNGLDLNTTTPFGIPILPFVIMSDYMEVPLDMVRVLLDHGANASDIPLALIDDEGGEVPKWMGKNSKVFIRALEARLSDEIR